jgi:hypothetical protein
MARRARPKDDRKQRGEAVVRKSRSMGKLLMLHSPIASWLRDEALQPHAGGQDGTVAEEMAKGEWTNTTRER